MNIVYKLFFLLFLCFFLTSCRVEVENPFENLFSDRIVVFSEKELVSPDGPEPMYLRVKHERNDIVNFYVGFLSSGKGMEGRIKCKSSSYNVITVLSSKIHNNKFKVSDGIFQFDSFGVGLKWIKVVFDKRILAGTLPERVALAACFMPNA